MRDDIDFENLSNSQLYKKLLGKTPYVEPWMEPIFRRMLSCGIWW